MPCRSVPSPTLVTWLAATEPHKSISSAPNTVQSGNHRASFLPPNSTRASDTSLPEIWILVSRAKSVKVSLQLGVSEIVDKTIQIKKNVLDNVNRVFESELHTHTEKENTTKVE